ncbi:hypothetical protein [Streptomyces chrestomyceticus]|uniref:hypothetical protein n=1 Tax=Streptomyces chrestomyceticus TaxID=68185 RepID=UPI0034022220
MTESPPSPVPLPRRVFLARTVLLGACGRNGTGRRRRSGRERAGAGGRRADRRAAAGPSPTLTTQAPATRTAERVFGQVFGGPPWVRTGSPMESTDVRVGRRLAELGL